MADPHDIDEDLLHRIRHAAFELRAEDPQGAVRELRKAAAQGGAAEVLARGALGEIYFEEFGDLDGAAAEYQKVLQLAPGLPAAQLGLGRVHREMGRNPEADAGLARALDGLQRDLRSFRDAKEPPPGAEEVVLSLMEVAIELLELRSNGSVGKLPLDEELLAWAEGARLFDALAEEDPDAAAEDWVRYHSLRAQLRSLQGRSEETPSLLEQAEKDGRLPEIHAARLRSEALEDVGDLEGAAVQARRLLDAEKTIGAPWEADDVLRTAALLVATGNDASAASYLTAAVTQFDELVRLADADTRSLYEADRKRLKDALEEPQPEGPPKLVRLGKK